MTRQDVAGLLWDRILLNAGNAWRAKRWMSSDESIVRVYLEKASVTANGFHQGWSQKGFIQVMGGDVGGFSFNYLPRNIKRNEAVEKVEVPPVIAQVIREVDKELTLKSCLTQGCPAEMVGAIKENNKDVLNWLALADWCEEDDNLLLAVRLRGFVETAKVSGS